MPNQQNFNFEQYEQKFRDALTYLPAMLGNDAVNFFLDSFTKQGWQGNVFEAWKPRRSVSWGRKNGKGRALLVQSGRLRRSIRITAISGMTVTIGTDVPYAKAHNEGLRLGMIQQVKSFTRKNPFGGATTVKPFTRRINQNIPKRQFMGDSPYLQAKLKRRLEAEIMKVFR
jgi:phage gpG-like protein